MIQSTHNNKKMLSRSATNDYIGNGIAQNKNLLVARFGSVEGMIVAEIMLKHPPLPYS